MACPPDASAGDALLIYRLGTDRYPVWEGAGAAVRGGRWNPPGAPVIYAAATQSLAMLERLVQGADLGGTVLVEADVPDDIAFDDLLRSPPPGWADVGSPAARGRRHLGAPEALMWDQRLFGITAPPRP